MSPASVTPAGSSQGPQCELAGRAGLPRDSHLLHSLHQCDRHTWVRNLRRAEWASRLLRRRPQLATKPESQRPHFPPSPAPPPPEGQSWAVTARYTCPWKEAVREAGGSSARHRTRPAGRWGARSEQRRGKGVPRGETRGKGVPGERPPGKGSRGVGGGEALREGGPRGEEPRGRRGPGERSPLGSTEDPHFRQRGRPSLLPEARAALTGTFRHGNPVCPRLPHIPSQAAGPPPGRGRARGGPEPPRGLSGTAVCADPTGRETLPL